MTDTIKTLKVYMRSGTIIIGKYAEDEYEEIYDRWIDNNGRMLFRNCEINVADIIAIEWEAPR
jgi:hypothetical protein